MTADTRDLISAFTHVLNDCRDEDPDVVARKLVVTAQGHGWRPEPTLARDRAISTPVPPSQVPAYLEAKAALQATTHPDEETR